MSLQKPDELLWVGIVDKYLTENHRLYTGRTEVFLSEDFARNTKSVRTVAKFAMPDGYVVRFKTEWTIAVEQIYNLGLDNNGFLELGAVTTSEALYRDFPVQAYKFHQREYMGDLGMWEWLGISNTEMWEWLTQGKYPPSWHPTQGNIMDEIIIDPSTGFAIRRGDAVQ